MDTGPSILAEADRLNLAGDFAAAEKLYDELLTQNHDSPTLLATLGTLYLRTKRNGLAIALLHRAIEQTPQSEMLCNLGVAYKYSGQYKKAMHWFNKAIEKNPTAETLSTHAGMHINIGTPEIALKSANKSLTMNPQHAMGHWNKAMALLEMGKWDTAWDEHEWGFDAGMRIRRRIGQGSPYWNGEKGKTVVVYGEQGLGDEIMFASMLPDMMKDNTVILECHSRLKKLFEKSFPGLRCYGTREDKEITWPEDHNVDYSVSIGSLGKWYRRSRESFPGTAYLKADALPKDKFRVGISWTGGLKLGRVLTRSIPLARWGSILNNRDMEFVSLQYTDCKAELDSVNRTYDVKERPEAKARDYYETAQLVKSCDLVISCCTSIIHLAGALGVPCWVMVPNKPAWRYGITGGMPWYKAVRLYRQPQGDAEAWTPVIERVGLDLSDLRERIAA